MVEQEDGEVHGHVLLAAEVDIEGIPVFHVLAYDPEKRHADLRIFGDLLLVALSEHHVIEELLGHVLRLYVPAVGVHRYYVVRGVQRRVGYGFDYPFFVEWELGSEPVALSDAGALPEPVQYPMYVGIVLRRIDLHVPAVRGCLLGEFFVPVIDEPLVVHPLDVNGLAAPADHFFGKVVEQFGLSGVDHRLLDLLFGLVDPHSGIRPACLPHAAGMEAVLVDLFLGLVEPGVVGRRYAEGLHGVPGGKVPVSLDPDYRDRIDRCDGLLVDPVFGVFADVVLDVLKIDPVVRRVGRHGCDHSRSDLGVAECGRQNGDDAAHHGRLACPSDQVAAPDGAEELDVVELHRQLVGGRLGDHPELSLVHDLVVFRIGVDPETYLAVDGLGPQGGGHEFHLPELELEQGVFLRLRVSSLGYVRLGCVNRDRAALGAEGGVVGLLYQQSRLHELSELPSYEFSVIRVQGAREPAPIGQEPEPFPIVVDVDFIEELDYRHGVREIPQLLVRAAVVLHVLYDVRILAFDPGGEADGAVARGVRSDRKHHVVAEKPLVPADGVGIRVASEMSDMKIACHPGICEYYHELGPLVARGHVYPGRRPLGLPFLFHISIVARHNHYPTLARRSTHGLYSILSMAQQHGIRKK